MRTSHLSELEIQQYALRELDCVEAIEEHIKLCEKCRSQVQTYATLFSAIVWQDKPVLDISEIVMRQISKPKVRNAFQGMLFYCICIVSVVVLGSSFYFLENQLHPLFSNLKLISLYCFVVISCTLLVLLLTEQYKIFKQKMVGLETNYVLKQKMIETV